MTQQASWTRALLEPDQTCPDGLKTWNGSDPTLRFAVYRNNVIASLIDALADTFAVTQALVGADFFRAMAREFVRISPPQSALLTFYGQSFPDFVAAFAPAASVDYLADVARLEMAYVESFHAADQSAIPATHLQSALADSQTLPGLHFTLHPSLKIVHSPYAIVSLWAAHQQHTPTELPDPYQAEHAWVMRNGLSVQVVRMGTGDCHFVAALATGLPLGEAVQMASGDDFDLARCLGRLLHLQLICGIEHSDGDTP